MDPKEELARRIRRVRRDRGWTQAELARALNLHRPAVSEIEAGRRSVTSEELAALSRLFTVPISDLLAGTSEGRGSPSALRETIRGMADVIVELFHPQAVILVGSHARGTADEHSDIDLLVVMDVEGSRRQLAARIGAALSDFRVPKDIVVTTPEAFRRRRSVPGTLERSAALEGEVLRAAR